MATYTKNLNLIKPHQDDYYNINDFNTNMDIIDDLASGNINVGSGNNNSNSSEEIATLTNKIAELEEKINALLTKEEVEEITKEEVARIVGTAPESLDTLEEIATAIEENQDIMTTLESAIGNKVNLSDFEEMTNEMGEFFDYIDGALNFILGNVFGEFDEEWVVWIRENAGGLYSLSWFMYLNMWEDI